MRMVELAEGLAGYLLIISYIMDSAKNMREFFINLTHMSGSYSLEGWPEY